VLADVGRDIRLGPPVVGFEGDSFPSWRRRTTGVALHTRVVDPGPAGRWRTGGPGAPGGEGGGGAKVEEGCSDQLVQGQGVQAVLYCEGVVVV